MQRSDQKGYFPFSHRRFYSDVINKANKFKADTSKLVKSLQNLIRRGYDYSSLFEICLFC